MDQNDKFHWLLCTETTGKKSQEGQILVNTQAEVFNEATALGAGSL